MTSLNTRIPEKYTKQSEHLLSCYNIADVINNAEMLFGMHIWEAVKEILIMCFKDKSIEEISEYILKNIK